MKSLLLAPHNDDETLWNSWNILRYKPHVIICLRSQVQEDRGTGITAAVRQLETARALWWLGDPTWEQWGYSDADPDWRDIEQRMGEFDLAHPDLERVFSPAQEEDGHEHHDAIGYYARKVFGDRVQPYLTYRRGFGRSTGFYVNGECVSGEEVPFESSWPAKKLRALSCYESQIAEPSVEYWFIDSELREYLP